ncbi:MAG: DNA circularization N-terminal domain-containing protein [Elusimicrobiales bacterium]
MVDALLTPAFYDDNGNRFAPELEFIEDGVENALVKHEYPFKNGAELEPMGLKARVVTMRAHFSGGNYGAHKTFLAWLKQSNPSRKFIHPVYGLLAGDIEKTHTRHDDTKQNAVIEITFVENGADAAPAAQKLAVGTAVNNAAVKGANNRLTWARNALNAAQKKYAAAKARVSAYQNKISSASAAFDAAMSSVSNPAASFTSLLNWTTDLPATMVLSCAKAVERYAVAYQTLKSAPANFIRKLDESFRALETSFAHFGGADPAAASAGAAARVTLKLSCAEALGAATADVFGSEQDLRDSLRAAEAAPAADADGNFLPQAADTGAASLMTADELESILAIARRYLQEAVDCARRNGLDPQSYKDIALALENHVNTVKLERESIIQVALDQPLPLHLVCLRNGLPFRAAERLLAINPALQNPNEAAGALNIYGANNG